MALINLFHVLKRALIVTLFTHSLWATTMVIAVHPSSSINHLSPAIIKKLYLDQQQLIDTIRPLKLSLPYQDPLRICFETKILHMKKEELQLYWLKNRYLGFRPPKVLASAQAVALYIQKVPNAIGYLPLKTAKQYGLKIVYQWKCEDEDKN